PLVRSMKIFIHIGDARTGSSTLQAMMAHNRARFLTIMARFPGLENLLDDMSLDRADRVQFNAMLVSHLSR
ncbi:MAG: hypothetical protein AAFQ05_14705, partial [Pseudomonadota bacterium]